MNARAKWLVGVLGVSLAVAGLLSPLASSSPDGLEAVAESAGLGERFAEEPVIGSPMQDYEAPGIESSAAATGIAGVVGTLACVFLALGLGRWLAGRDRQDSDGR